MKLLLICSVFLALAAGPESCGSKKMSPACFKGRLEVKGICSNYTIKVLEGAGQSWTQAAWTDEQTGKQYTQVFRLANPCAFPDTIQEGDTFSFVLDTSKQERCTVCMAYYPTPEKAAAIKVVKSCE